MPLYAILSNFHSMDRVDTGHVVDQVCIQGLITVVALGFRGKLKYHFPRSFVDLSRPDPNITLTNSN